MHPSPTASTVLLGDSTPTQAEESLSKLEVRDHRTHVRAVRTRSRERARPPVLFTGELKYVGPGTDTPIHLTKDSNAVKSVLKKSEQGWYRPKYNLPPHQSKIERLFSPSLRIQRPIESLFHYLACAAVERYDRWPGVDLSDSLRRFFAADPLAGEWRRRYDVAQQHWNRRELKTWRHDPHFLVDTRNRVLEDVPGTPLHPADQRGELVFALPAPGFATKEFQMRFVRHLSLDRCLLQWLNCTVLQTAVSTAQTLRANSCTTQFWCVPSEGSMDGYAGLPDGYGSLVLSPSASPTDKRALLVLVRPPNVYTGSILRAFTLDDKAWKFEEPAGHSNLLQAQVYDECVTPRVRYWVVTTVKYWIFGVFDEEYNKCTVSPVIAREARDPTVLQGLVSWILRALDSLDLPVFNEEVPILSRAVVAYPPPPTLQAVPKPPMQSRATPTPPFGPRKHKGSLEMTMERQRRARREERERKRKQAAIATASPSGTRDVIPHALQVDDGATATERSGRREEGRSPNPDDWEEIQRAREHDLELQHKAEKAMRRDKRRLKREARKRERELRESGHFGWHEFGYYPQHVLGPQPANQYNRYVYTYPAPLHYTAYFPAWTG